MKIVKIVKIVKIAMIIMAVVSVVFAGHAVFMLARADAPRQVVLWAILLAMHLFNCVIIGNALGKCIDC